MIVYFTLYWHDKKRENYHSLCTSIKANGWRVFFFAVEVGAIGYAAESLLSCLRCLGFPTKLCRSTIKNMSTNCLKCSFDIWMARNCSSWKLEGPCKSPSDVASLYFSFLSVDPSIFKDCFVSTRNKES